MNFTNFFKHQRNQKIFEFDYFKKLVLFTLTSLVFLQFLQDTYVYYYYLIIGAVAISIITIIFDFKKIDLKFRDPLTIFFILLLLCFFLITLTTLIQSSDWNSPANNLFIAIGKLWISPLFAIILFFLVNTKKDLNRIIYLYIFIFLLAVISIFLQNLFGHIPLFGNDYYGLNENNQARYTIVGYSSIIGSVVAYGVSFYTAIFFIIFITRFNYIIKGILISLILIGAILTMSKAAFINIFLILLLLSFFLKKDQIWKILLIAIICTCILIYCSTHLTVATLALSSNILGIELGTDNLINSKYYTSIFDRAIGRLGFNYDFPELLNSTMDYILGVGLIAGGGVFNSIFVGTSHNTFIDLYAMGGIPIIVSIVLLICTIQIKLLKIYFTHKDKISLAFTLSNFLLFFNMFFFNGGLFQPLISFSFWLSLVYLFKMQFSLFNQKLQS